MKITEIRKRAKSMGLKAGGGKADLIRRIQTAEGNEACFGGRSACAEMNCCWREDCLPGEWTQPTAC